MIQIYTDGSCHPNPGPGGWGAVILDGALTTELWGAHVEDETTNNRMEMQAAISALNFLPPSTVLLYSDSQYVCNLWGIKKYKELNHDLWEDLRQAIERHPKVDFVWVRGHSNVPWNERADLLADDGRDKGIEDRAIGRTVSLTGIREIVEELEEFDL